MTARTIVSLHAHPDDETLLTGGTLARLHAEGHRVVVVTATDGALGLAEGGLRRRGLAGVRSAELRAACAALGVDRLVELAHPDSGMHDEGPPGRFSVLDTDRIAAQIAEVLTDERADVLTIYDRRGGYGHPDHVRIHTVGLAAAQLAGTPLVLQATVDRTRLRRVLRAVEWIPGLPEGFSSRSVAAGFAEPEELTHRVDVRAFVAAKRAAMAAHCSQATADTGDRTMAVALRLPKPLYRRVFGYEWFAEVGRGRGERLATHPLDSLSSATPPCSEPPASEASPPTPPAGNSSGRSSGRSDSPG